MMDAPQVLPSSRSPSPLPLVLPTLSPTSQVWRQLVEGVESVSPTFQTADPFPQKRRGRSENSEDDMSECEALWRPKKIRQTSPRPLSPDLFPEDEELTDLELLEEYEEDAETGELVRVFRAVEATPPPEASGSGSQLRPSSPDLTKEYLDSLNTQGSSSEDWGPLGPTPERACHRLPRSSWKTPDERLLFEAKLFQSFSSPVKPRRKLKHYLDNFSGASKWSSPSSKFYCHPSSPSGAARLKADADIFLSYGKPSEKRTELDYLRNRPLLPPKLEVEESLPEVTESLIARRALERTNAKLAREKIQSLFTSSGTEAFLGISSEEGMIKRRKWRKKVIACGVKSLGAPLATSSSSGVSSQGTQQTKLLATPGTSPSQRKRASTLSEKPLGKGRLSSDVKPSRVKTTPVSAKVAASRKKGISSSLKGLKDSALSTPVSNAPSSFVPPNPPTARAKATEEARREREASREAMEREQEIVRKKNRAKLIRRLEKRVALRVASLTPPATSSTMVASPSSCSRPSTTLSPSTTSLSTLLTASPTPLATVDSALKWPKPSSFPLQVPATTPTRIYPASHAPSFRDAPLPSPASPPSQTTASRKRTLCHDSWQGAAFFPRQSSVITPPAQQSTEHTPAPSNGTAPPSTVPPASRYPTILLNQSSIKYQLPLPHNSVSPTNSLELAALSTSHFLTSAWARMHRAQTGDNTVFPPSSQSPTPLLDAFSTTQSPLPANTTSTPPPPPNASTISLPIHLPTLPRIAGTAHPILELSNQKIKATPTVPAWTIDKSDWVEPEVLPILRGKPPVWCMSRQELCESLPYYRAYQSGHYDNGGRCYGYLLDGYPSMKDSCTDGGRVIISHGGGCSDAQGKSLRDSQSRDNMRVRALLNCYREAVPVALIAGTKFNHFTKLESLGVRYAVLGHYLVTEVWAEGEIVSELEEEVQTYFVRFKFRFEWVQSQGTPWFADLIDDSSLTETRGSPLLNATLSPLEPLPTGASAASSRDRFTCETCHEEQTRVYEEAVSCYNERCSNFFMLDGKFAIVQHLTFRSSFLLRRQDPLRGSKVPQQIRPLGLTHSETASSCLRYEKSAWRALHCAHCGRLSSRTKWMALYCQSCHFEVTLDLPPARAINLPGGVVTPRKPPVTHGLTPIFVRMEGFSGHIFELSAASRVYHLWPSTLSEADALFQEFQKNETAQLFRRNRLSTHRLAGQFLCSQFSFNAGLDYKYIAHVDTVSFDAGPKVVRDARRYLENISKRVVQNPASAVFNEVLSVAYMDGNKMSYHDDGEVGLGEVVSTLSLGSGATMNFRRKEKKVKRTIGIPRLKKEPRTPIVTLQLQHGDILIMDGTDVQRDFEHAVVPESLRFAATARYIGPNHLSRYATASNPPTARLPSLKVESVAAPSSEIRSPPPTLCKGGSITSIL